jgi:ribosomal protein S1
MEELLAATGHSIKSFTRGEKIRAKLLRVNERSAAFDVGGKSEGIVNDINFVEARSLINSLAPGDEVFAVVIEPESRDGVALLSLRGAAQDDFWKKMDKLSREDKPVEVIVKAVNPHGLVVALETETGFIPSSQLGAEVARKGEEIVGEHLKAKIIDLDQDNLRIVLSEKAVSEAKEMERVASALKDIKVGEKYRGRVTTITAFGAFVEIKVPAGEAKQISVEGLVHVSELSWTKVGKPEEVVSVGQEVEVSVIGTERNKLSLSMKAALADPWEKIEEKYHEDDRVSGKVVRVSDFGAFVELAPGIEGLVHITKIPPGTQLKTGQKVECYIEEVNKREQRIALGLVITTSKPVGYK